jgi:secreted PhoX family phosphatase
MLLNRREFTAAGAAALAFCGAARATQSEQQTYRNEVEGYGPLLRDPAGLLDLPRGFRYSVISSFGESMDDGYAVPDKFDGMGCFPLGRDRVALVRNHELKPVDREIGPTRGIARLERRLQSEAHYGRDKDGQVLPGGTSTVVVNLRTGRRERQFLSLAGTAVNCAGGITPWGSWLSCEETVIDEREVGRSHGWMFEVPANRRGLSKARPLTAMGRFRHEAAAIDPRTGIVYLTEDKDDSLFYRFLPATPGKLGEGGRLQALAIVDRHSADTRNWREAWLKPRRALAVRWIDMDQVDSPADDLRLRGRAAGAAIFARGEGIHFGQGELFFTCTSGGAAKLGQIMKLVPSSTSDTLSLFVESADASLFDYGDNLTVAPWGDLIVCEDRTDGKTNHLRGVTPAGRIYTFARLHMDTELAGVCFSPDGRTMFLNAYSPGRTFLITGPWTA